MGGAKTTKGPVMFFVSALVLALMLVAAGCGSGDSGGTTALTKAEFIKQGDAICEKGADQIRSKAAAYFKANGVKKGEVLPFALYFKVEEKIYIPTKQKQVGEIRALGAPAGEEQEVEEILDAFEAGLKKAEKDPTTLPTPSSPLTKPKKMYQAYGFKVCDKT